MHPFAKSITPTIQQPITAASPNAGVRIPDPELLPAPKDGETAKPRVIGCLPMWRGKRNPVHQVTVFSLVFPQFMLPSEWSEARKADADPRRIIQATLPVVALTDSQVEAVWRKAKSMTRKATFMPPPPPLPEPGEEKPVDLELRGYHEIPLNEIIFIGDYEEGRDLFHQARAAAAEREAMDSAGSEEPKIDAADEKNAIEQSLLAQNEKPQRDDQSDGPKKGNGKGK